MSKKNDQVFPVSLSEIAFMLVFLLMLLLGFMIIRDQREKAELKRRLEYAHHAQSTEVSQATLENAKSQFEASMRAAGHPSPQDITKKLVDGSEVRAERDRLRREVQDLSERLSALESLREKIEKATEQGDKVAREEIEHALALQNEIRKFTGDQAHGATTAASKELRGRIKDAIAATNTLREQAKSKLGMEIKPGDEPAAMREVIEAAKLAAVVTADKNSPGLRKAEIEKLRGQIQYFTNRNRFHGLDHPPCWVDASGKIEFLFSVETRPDGFIATKAWPPNREQEARTLPNIEQALSSGTMKMLDFSVTMQPILAWSQKQDPECRHFVFIATTIGDADARDSARKVVEGFFYKFEVKR